MLKTLALSLITLSTVATTAAAKECVLPKTLMERTALIESEGRGKGSGVFYDKDIVLTNEHVVRGLEHIWVYVPHMQRDYKADVIYSAIRPDIAILKLQEPVENITPLTLARKVLKKENLQLSSFPFARKDRLGTAIAKFNTFARFKSDTRLLYMNATLSDWAYGGDSGGGLFNCKGQLVGILFGNMATENLPDHIYAVNFRAIEDALKKAKLPVRRPQ
jgi:serine protease Do